MRITLQSDQKISRNPHDVVGDSLVLVGSTLEAPSGFRAEHAEHGNFEVPPGTRTVRVARIVDEQEEIKEIVD